MNAAVASQCVAPARIMRPVAPRVATTARCAHIAVSRSLNAIRCNAAAEVRHFDGCRRGTCPASISTAGSDAWEARRGRFRLGISSPPLLVPLPLSRSPAHPLTRPRRFSILSVQAPVAPVTNAAEPSYDAPAATYAVVDIGGHQLIVEEGRWYTVNRLDVPDGSVIELGRVLALKHDGEFKVGQPYLDGVKVTAEILGEEKGDKVIVYKMKPKKHYRRTNGHRQPLTKFLVTKISS